MSEPRLTRKIAIDALHRIDEGGAYANIVLPQLLQRSPLDQRDRALVTEMVYGTTRARRGCDWLVDRFLISPVEPRVRAALRLGAYQLVYMRVAPHAAVDTTVGAAPARARRLVNAVLRKVAAEADPVWPDDATRLSYPDWIVDRFVAELGPADAIAALERMNEAPAVVQRDDGYRQDRSSQLVAELVGAAPGERVADICAAPGGKATALAARGATVLASDVRASRLGLVRANRDALVAHTLTIVQADGSRLPYRDGAFDRVLVDAPCSGLGALRRRPDARWRVTPQAVSELAELQARLLAEAARVTRPGGTVVYSVCTLTDAETVAVIDRRPAGLVAEALGWPWRRRGEGGQLLPHHEDSDGMFAARFQRTRGGSAGQSAEDG